MNSSEYSIIKKFLITNKSFFSNKQVELDYLLENPEELNDIISKIYSNFKKYNQNIMPFTDIKWYLENVLDKKVFWSSYYLKELYFNRERINSKGKVFFNGLETTFEELLEIFVKMKEENPYSFVLSNNGYEVIRDFILDYYSITMHSELENKLYRLMPKNYILDSSSLLDSYSSSSLDSLIENYLIEIL